MERSQANQDKSDANDAEAICEAISRPGMRFVELRTVQQQELQALQQVRSVLQYAARKTDARSRWLQRTGQRTHSVSMVR